MKLISQGAEAKIYLDNNIIQKQRTSKGYRHKDLDNQIRTRRTKSETKILTKAFSVGANVPKVISSDKYNIQIEFIDGDRLSETLNSYPEKKQFQIMQAIGTQVALLHKNNIIHADLTTSNVILHLTPNPYHLTPTKSEIYLIDFGLSFVSTKIEDKAVDLHLIKQALEAKHFRSPDHLLGQNHKELFKQFLKTYKDKEVIERLKTVEKRGRYKH